MKRFPIANYWPAVLFTISYVAAVALVIQANRSYGDSDAESSPELAATPRDVGDDPFAKLDAFDAEASDGGHTPLLLTDFGEQFDTDFRTQRQREGLLGLLDKVGDSIKRVRLRAETRQRLEAREARERELAGERYRINWFDRTRPGSLLGFSDLSMPADLGDLPPLPPATAFDLPGGSIFSRDGRSLDIKIDPRLFRDEAALAEFVAKLRATLVTGGLEPTFLVTDDRGGTAPLPAGVASRIAALPTMPGQPLPPRAPAATPPLRAAPSDLRAGAEEPRFNPELVPGENTVVLRRPPSLPSGPDPPAAPSIPSRAAAEPLGPPLPQPPSHVRNGPADGDSPGNIPLAGSDSGAGGERPAPAEDQPVAIRIRLASFPSQAAAERAVAQLRDAGFGGSLNKTTDGLDYWIVHTRVFSTRREANAALSRIRALGYEAWQN